MHLSIYLLPLLGLFIGLLVSIIGGGGGIFYVGLLTSLFSIPMNEAVSVSLATIIPTTLASTISHYKEGNVVIKTGLIFILGGIIGVITGSFFITLIPQRTLKIIFGIFLLYMAVNMYLSRKKNNENKIKNNKDEKAMTMDSKLSKSYIIKASLYGLCGGLMSGMLGISGTAPILAGLYSLGLSSTMVVGTSTMILLFIAISGVITHSAFGSLNMQIVILLAIGTVIGAILGPILEKKVNQDILDKIYGPFFTIFVLIMAIIMFF